jgi:hypothetical protein
VISDSGGRVLGDPEITGGYVRVAVQNRVVITTRHYDVM